MKVVFFGTPDFAVPTLEKLVTSRHEVSLVVSRPDRPVGRRQIIESPPVIEAARAHGIECSQPKNLKGDAIDAKLREIDVEAAVVVAYGKLIPARLLEIPRYGFINLHPSLLPRHRGPSPIQWALVCGDRATGVTTMQILPGSANLIGGRSVVVKTYPRARSVHDARFPGAPNGLKMACGENPKRVYKEKGGPITRMGNLARMRAAFQLAVEYRRSWKRYREKLPRHRSAGGGAAVRE